MIHIVVGSGRKKSIGFRFELERRLAKIGTHRIVAFCAALLAQAASAQTLKRSTTQTLAHTTCAREAREAKKQTYFSSRAREQKSIPFREAIKV